MIFADLHAHPFLRPFENKEDGSGLMSRNPNDVSCVWNEYDLPKSSIRHIIGENAGFTTYSESDFTQCAKSSVRLIAVSLYPPESGFFEIPNSDTFDKIINIFRLKYTAEIELGHIVSSFSKSNIRRIKANDYDYFLELLNQLKYIKDTTPYKPDPLQCVGTEYSQIKNAGYTILDDGSQVQLLNSDPVIQVFLNVEGGNALWSNTILSGNEVWNGRNFNDHTTDKILQNYQVLDGVDFRNRVTKEMVENNPSAMTQLWSKAACDMVLKNLRTLISKGKIFSLTISHHFYNGLCGHCDSLQPITALELCDQSFGINSDITHLGYMVINELLKNNILIDVKHMSWKARKSYYRFRDNNYPGIPVLWSHSAVSGRKAVGDNDSVDTWNPNLLYKVSLNLYDDDIFETVRSNGLIGIEFDRRVNGVKNSGIDTLWKNFQYIGFAK